MGGLFTVPKRIIGVSARLLDCAKEEFLEKGFQNASIREIAKKADTSPRAVYTRFPNKEGLFDAIVEPVVDGFIDLYQKFGDTFWSEHKGAMSVPNFSADPNAVYIEMMDYIYDHADTFKLAMGCLEGSRYVAMIEKVTSINSGFLEQFAELRKENIGNFDVMLKVLHMLTHSFYTALFEPIRHDMSREDARFYVIKLCNFFVCGIQGLNLVK